MKAVYVAKASIPSTSANSIHVMKISECFKELCGDFELITCHNPDPRIKEDIFEFYGIEHSFPIVNLEKKDKLGGMYNYYFAWKAFRVINKKKVNVVITRDPLVAFLTVMARIDTILDLHGELAHICGRAYRMMKYDFFRKNKHLKLVMITKSLVRYYEKKYGIDPKMVTVLPDGCTLKNFEPYSNRELFQDSVMKLAYAGSFGVGRGYEVIQELAKQDDQNQYSIYGGLKEDAQKVTGKIPSKHIHFKGFIPNREIPKELCNQDILLLPYQNKLIAKGEDTGKVMSPLKLFEYMASGRVIVASDLGVLREILDESNCYFAVPDDVESWKKVIKHIANHKEEAVAKADKAKEDVKQYTWMLRAERMLKLLSSDK